MTSSVVGGARVEITMDLAKFGSEAKTQLTQALGSNDLKSAVTKSLDNAASGAAAAGQKAGKASADGMASGITSEKGKVTEAADGVGHEAGQQMSSGIGSGLKGVGAIVVGILGGQLAAAGISKVFDFAKEAVFGFNSTVEQANIGFTTMLGSGQKAQDFLGQLKTFAKSTPFDFEGLVQNSQTLLGMGIQAKDIIPDLTALGDSVASVGGNADELNNTILAFAQTSAKGTLDMGNMTQLLQGGVPNALKILAAQYHVTTGAMVDMISSGKVQSSEALPLLVKGLEQGTSATAALGGMMDKQSQTFSGALSNIHDALTQSLAGAFHPFFDSVSGGLQVTANWLSSPAFTKIGDKLTSGLQAAVGWVVDNFPAFRNLLETTFAGVGQSITAIWPTIQALAGAIMQIASVVLPVFLQAWQAAEAPLEAAFKFIVTTAIPAIKALSDWIKDHENLVRTLVVVIGTAVLAWKAWTLAVNVSKAATTAFKDAQAALKVVMATNPFILIVGALIALAAGLVYAYKHSQTFRDIVKETWSIVQRYFNDAWKVIKSVIDALITAWRAVWSAISTAWNTVGKPIFDVIAAAVRFWWGIAKGIFDLFIDEWRLVWTIVQGAWNNVGKPIFDAISTVVQWLWNNIIHPAVQGMEEEFNTLWGFLQSIWNNVGKPVFDTIASVTGAIGSGLKWAYDNVLKPVGDLIGQVWSGIKAGWDGLWNGMTSVPDAIWAGIKGVAHMFGSIMNGIIGAINTLIHGFNDATHGLSDVWSWAGIPSIPSIPDIPKMNLAMGATVLPTAGGTLVRLAEAGRPETVVDTGLMNRLIGTVTSDLDNRPAVPPGSAGPTPEQWDGLIGAVMDAASGPRNIMLDSRLIAKITDETNRTQARRA